jgi:hypothetical protein
VLPDVEPSPRVVRHEHGRRDFLESGHVDQQEECEKQDREQREPDRERRAREPEKRRDRVWDRRGQVVRALLDVLGGARVAEPGKLARVAEVADDVREVLEEVAHRARERDEQQQGEHRGSNRGAERDDRRGRASSPARPSHERPHGDLEDEREEDPEEDEKERVRDRHDRDGHGRDERGEDQRADRDGALDGLAPRARRSVPSWLQALHLGHDALHLGVEDGPDTRRA